MKINDRLRFSPYAPVRYQNEPWWRYAADAASNDLVLKDGRIASQFLEKIDTDLVNPAIRRCLMNIDPGSPDPGDHGNLAGAFCAKMMELRHWVPLAAQYLNSGRQIFDLTDEVVEMLEQTDFGDCTIEDWHLPYDAFFVHFGKREAIRLPWGDDFEYLDGAFVATTPYDEKGRLRLKLGFTTCKRTGEGVMSPGYFIDFNPEEHALPVAVAIEHAIKRRVNAFLDQPGDSESLKAVKAHRRALIEEGGEILKLAASLIVNVLFYLESLGPQRRSEPGRDAPTDYTVRWERSNPRQQEKLKSRLLSEGYTAVYLLGREFSTTRAAVLGGHRRIHWRRGHWRRQPHGEGNSLIKRKWIKPQVIGAGPPDDAPGHIYVVGNTETPDTRH